MDGFTTSLLASATYSLILKGVEITNMSLKGALQKWLLSDTELDLIAASIKNGQIDEDWSEKRIEKYFNTQPELLDIMSRTQANQSVTINQQHSGTGNNEANIKF